MSGTTTDPHHGAEVGTRRPLRDRILRPSRRATRIALWANLAAQVAIVVTGAVVRLTGSGLGCSEWPECEPGQFTPVRHEASNLHSFIEFGNRTLTGVLVLLAVAALWVVWRQPGRRTSLRALAVVPLVGVLVQAVIGGLTVLVELHPVWVGSHLLISMLLIAASTVLVIREAQPGPARWVIGKASRALVIALVPLAIAVLTLGTVVTGSGPHSGDDDAPYRYAVDPLMVTRAHSSAVWVFLVVLILLLVVLRRSASGDRTATRGGRRAAELLGLSLAQGAVGYVQYFTGLPEFLVGLHMLLAALMVVSLTALVVTVRSAADPELRGVDLSPAS